MRPLPAPGGDPVIAEVIRVSVPLAQLIGIIGVTGAVGLVLGALAARR